LVKINQMDARLPDVAPELLRLALLLALYGLLAYWRYFRTADRRPAASPAP